MPIDRELQRDLSGCRAAHAVLLDRLEAWSAAGGDPSAPSRLPGWTVGHVLTHLARNADSLVGMVVAAGEGRVADQYPSRESRDADIEAGAGRSAAELVADCRATIDRLEAAWSRSEFEGTGRGLIVKVIPIAELPHRRWREVEVHHVDLGLGHEPEDWPTEYVRLELRRQEMTAKSRMPMGMTTWPPSVLAMSDARRLAWLYGRHDEPGLPELAPWA